MDNKAELPPEEIARQSVERFRAMASAKYGRPSRTRRRPSSEGEAGTLERGDH